MDEFERLRRETARHRITFIGIDIDVGMTFVKLAVTALSTGKAARVDRLLQKARRAHEATATLLAEVDDMEERRRLHDRHQALGDAILEMEHRKRRSGEEHL